MQRAFSFALAAERSRYKERLEATLAGLCELEMLKQRQERLVLSALSLGDPGPACARAAWPLIRHCFPSSANLEQEEPGSADQQVRQRARFPIPRLEFRGLGKWSELVLSTAFLSLRLFHNVDPLYKPLHLVFGSTPNFLSSACLCTALDPCSTVKQISMAPLGFSN